MHTNNHIHVHAHCTRTCTCITYQAKSQRFMNGTVIHVHYRHNTTPPSVRYEPPPSLPHSLQLPHTHPPSPTLTPTHSNSHPHPHSLQPPHTHPHSLTHSNSHTHTHPHTLTNSNSHTHPHTPTHSNSHPHPHSLQPPHTHPHTLTHSSSSSLSCTEDETDLNSLAFSSLYTDAASYARMGTSLANMSRPMLLGSEGWNEMGFTRSAPGTERKTGITTTTFTEIYKHLVMVITVRNQNLTQLVPV